MKAATLIWEADHWECTGEVSSLSLAQSFFSLFPSGDETHSSTMCLFLPHDKPASPDGTSQVNPAPLQLVSSGIWPQQ